MTACLLLIGSLLIVGLILRLTHRDDRDSEDSRSSTVVTPVNHGEFCCGTHEVCQKFNENILNGPDYYDDEELDRFAGRNGDDYDFKEIDEFRDVLYTLLPTDIAGWSVSLQKRGIIIPTDLKDELIMLLSENSKEINVAP